MIFDFGDTDPRDTIDPSASQPGVMGEMWLNNLANVMRAVGLVVIEVDGWERRGRQNNSGYSLVPTTVMNHHTASDTSAENDVNYMTFNADVAPLANLYIARNGDVHVMAGGPTNTNGEGEDTWGGGVPEDSMNSYAVGIEMGNTGVGEEWTQIQMNAALVVNAALCHVLNLPSSQCRGHEEYAPTRKIDPAGPPRYANGSATWNMDQFRDDVQAILDGTNPGGNVIATRTEVLVPPIRILDSRDFGDEAGRLGDARPDDNGIRVIGVPGVGDAVAVEVVVTMIDPRVPGFITAYSSGPVPGTSDVNASPGTAAIANTTVIPLHNGKFSIFAVGDMHVALDLKSYLRP